MRSLRHAADASGKYFKTTALRLSVSTLCFSFSIWADRIAHPKHPGRESAQPLCHEASVLQVWKPGPHCRGLQLPRTTLLQLQAAGPRVDDVPAAEIDRGKTVLRVPGIWTHSERVPVGAQDGKLQCLWSSGPLDEGLSWASRPGPAKHYRTELTDAKEPQQATDVLQVWWTASRCARLSGRCRQVLRMRQKRTHSSAQWRAQAPRTPSCATTVADPSILHCTMPPKMSLDR